MNHEPNIHPPFEAFYIESMLWHTNSVLDAVKIVGDWIEHVMNENEEALNFPKEKLFEQLQLIIQNAASLSKYLWPIQNNGIHKKRGIKIKNALQTDDTSALKNKNLRNGLEHFDEKLDKYLRENQVGQFTHHDVRAEMPVSEIPLHIFKGFYINTRCFVLLGTEYQTLPIITEVERIHDLLIKCKQHGYRFESYTHNKSFK